MTFITLLCVPSVIAVGTLFGALLRVTSRRAQAQVIVLIEFTKLLRHNISLEHYTASRISSNSFTYFRRNIPKK